MGTATMATAVAVAMVLYFVLSRRLANEDAVGGAAGGGGGGGRGKRRRGRAPRRPAQPPATWIEAVGTLAETLRFTYSETLGKWPIGDLAFGIKYLMRRQVSQLFLLADQSLDCLPLGSDASGGLVCVCKLAFFGSEI
jgi:hypothetical protein